MKRIVVHFAPANDGRCVLPFEYHEHFLRLLHKFLGRNNEQHDTLSLYSWFLCGTRLVDVGFDISQGCSWVFSSWDDAMAQRVATEAMGYNEPFLGLRVASVVEEVELPAQHQRRFLLGSAALVKFHENESTKHLRFDDERASATMTKTLQTKMAKVGMSGDIEVRFDTMYRNAKTKMITIHNVNNRCNLCPVIITGEPEAVRFAWAVGIGNSTGSGFGGVI